MSELKDKEVKITGVNVTPAPQGSVDDQIKQAELAARQLELEIKKQELAAKTLEIQERQYNIKDLKKRLMDREIQEKQAMEDLQQQGKTFAQQQQTDRVRQTSCTHRKGGMAHARNLEVLHTGGDASQRSVIKHRMINNDIWVRCTRCGKTWAPPIKTKFYFDENGRQVAPADGSFDQGKFNDAQREYMEAIKFETRSSMSSSVICSFHKWDDKAHEWVDGNAEYRQSMADTNLR